MIARRKTATAALELKKVTFFSLDELKAALDDMARTHPVALDEAGKEFCGAAALFYTDQGAARLAIITRRIA